MNTWSWGWQYEHTTLIVREAISEAVSTAVNEALSRAMPLSVGESNRDSTGGTSGRKKTLSAYLPSSLIKEEM